jgi:hypothetical protein
MNVTPSKFRPSARKTRKIARVTERGGDGGVGVHCVKECPSPSLLCSSNKTIITDANLYSTNGKIFVTDL